MFKAKQSRSFYSKFIVVIMVTVAAAASVYYVHHQIASEQTLAYNRYIFAGDERDIHDVERLFADPDDRYLLTTRPEYDVRSMMTYRMSEYDDPSTVGNLTIMIARDKAIGNFIGFTAHHKLSFYRSKLLFLAIDAQARGKGYGRSMIMQALHDMRREGARKVVLDAREENKRARALYESVGFKEQYVSHGFVRYEVDVTAL